MKKTLLFFISCIALAVSCKKNNNDQPVSATAQQLAAINAKLSGTWASAGIPLNSLSPRIGSVVFDGQSISSLTDYADNQVQKPYKLTGSSNTYYININTPDLVRISKIMSLTADSLKLQSTVTDTNGSKKNTFNETFVRANATEIKNKIFKINILPFTGGTTIQGVLNVNVKIYITVKGGNEQLVESKNGITQAYSYAYTPLVGDHIRILIVNVIAPGNLPIATCLATYKGVPYGRDWQSALFSTLPDKSWDIRD